MFVFSLIVFIATLSGWLLAIFMGRSRWPKNHTERAAVGPIWISIVAILFFFGGVETFWVNLACGFSIAGFLARSLWELGLRHHVRSEEIEKLVRLAEANEREVTITVVPHYANNPGKDPVYPHRLGGTGINRLV